MTISYGLLITHELSTLCGEKSGSTYVHEILSKSSLAGEGGDLEGTELKEW